MKTNSTMPGSYCAQAGSKMLRIFCKDPRSKMGNQSSHQGPKGCKHSVQTGDLSSKMQDMILFLIQNAANRKGSCPKKPQNKINNPENKNMNHGQISLS